MSIIKQHKRKSHFSKKVMLLFLISALCFCYGCGKAETASTKETTVVQTTSVEEEITLNPSGETDNATETVIQAEEAADTVTEQVTEATETTEDAYDFRICFAGDINLDENWDTTRYLDKCKGDISRCISPELLFHMQGADIMCLNNEFTYSTTGSPMSGKTYTFRANPSRVWVLREMGVDVVKLANNHVYDYGKQAFLDTMETLKEAGIKYVGAGENLQKAMEPVYFEIQGKTIAFVAASRAEKNVMTPQAGTNSPGILRCYDTTLFKQVIREAKAHADFVLAYVHWGTEYSYQLEKVQKTTAREYLEAGADAVIGAHTHCLQGMEYYEGKPIIYSLGNFWFNNKDLDTMLLDLHFFGTGEQQNLEVQIVPARQSGCQTKIMSEKEEQMRFYDFLEGISVNVVIDENGVLKSS